MQRSIGLSARAGMLGTGRIAAPARTGAAAIASATRQARRPAAVRQIRVRAGAEEQGELQASSREPEDARGAIAIGLDLCEAGKYKEAVAVFEKALELPGTGVKRYRDKPRLISEGEKQSVLYNIACCYSRMEDARTGLVALAGCLEAGYDDVAQLKSDPDLAFLRSDSRFEGLLSRFKLGGKKGVLQDFLAGFNL